ncbi:hypothetical protein AC579_3412 [Pseudocercospora musae]|uniref:Uncharacterized protein n=1 Tax=Pseudocercospora musae TaxID=113226 RepID=A0A139IL39_9PEZI|nr:hypothetical protein AC579_3412 [Pseudocercospora musae]
MWCKRSEKAVAKLHVPFSTSHSPLYTSCAAEHFLLDSSPQRSTDMASDPKRSKSGDRSPRLRVSLPLREHDAFARAYAVQAVRVVSSTTASTAIQISKTSSTGFLDLAREVRDEIYYLAVVEQDDIKSQCIESGTTHGIYYNPALTNVSRLSRVCKQVRREALETFFKHNRFRVANTHVWPRANWQGWASEKKMADLFKRLKHFEIKLYDYPNVHIEQQTDGSWNGSWDDTDWSFLGSEDDEEVSEDIIEEVCEATEEHLERLLSAMKEHPEHISDAIERFREEILVVYAEARKRASEDTNRI